MPRLWCTLLRLCFSPCVACHTKPRRREVWLGRTQFPRHKCLRGIPDDLMALRLSNLLIVEPATDVADCEPWLGCVGNSRTDLFEIGQVIDDIKKKSITYSNDFIRISSANLSMSVVHPLHQSKHSKN